MNLVADENIDRRIVERLRLDGHHVEWISDVSPSVSDEEVLQLATSSKALLVTEDKDFRELVYRRGLSHAGVLLVRLEGLDNTVKAEVVAKAIRDNTKDLPGAFAVITVDSIRIRRPADGRSPEVRDASFP